MQFTTGKLNALGETAVYISANKETALFLVFNEEADAESAAHAFNYVFRTYNQLFPNGKPND